MSFASASSSTRKTFGNDSDTFSPSGNTETPTSSRFSHFSSSHHNDDDNKTGTSSTTPRIDRFSFNRFGLQRDDNNRRDRPEARSFARSNDDFRDNRRDRDDNKTGTGDRPPRRFERKDGDEGGGWNTVTRPRKSFGHNDDGEKFRREHGKPTGDRGDRDTKDSRPNRYEAFSRDKGDKDTGERTERREGGGGGWKDRTEGGWKDREQNKRREGGGGKGREESSWFLTEEERAARAAARDREYREQREARLAEREFRNGGGGGGDRRGHDRDRDREHRDRDRDNETFGDSSSRGFGRFDKQEKEPEWMDAMPGNDGKEFKAHSTEDFQRWKAAMKARNQQQAPAEEKPTPKESKDEEIVFKSKAEKRATAMEEAQNEPVEELPTPSIAENGVDRFWGWNTSSTSLASKAPSEGGAKLPVQSGEKTPAVERSSRFRSFFNAPIQDQMPEPQPAPPAQNGNQEQQAQQLAAQQLAQMQAQQVQQIHQQHQMLQKQLGQTQVPQGNISEYQLYQMQQTEQMLRQSNAQQLALQAAQQQQQQQQPKDKHAETSKEDREGFNNILQMLGRARLSSPPNAEAQNAFLSILGAPSQHGTPVSHGNPTPPANHPTNNMPGPPPPPQQHAGMARQAQASLQQLHTGSAGSGNETILKLLRHADMPTPQGPPPPPQFIPDYQTSNRPPVSVSPPVVQQRSGKNSVTGTLNDPAIRAIGRPPNEGPPGLPKNLYHDPPPPQHVRSPSQIMEAHHRAFPGMEIRPPPGIDQRTAQMEPPKSAGFLNEQAQRGMDPRHIELLRSEQQRRLMEQQMQMAAAVGVESIPHRNFPPNPPPRLEQRGPQGPPQPQGPPGPPNAEQGPPMGMPGMGENGHMPNNWAPGPQQHPSQNQSVPSGNANPQRPPPGFFQQRGPGGPPGPANGGNVNGPGGPAGPMPPLPFYGPGMGNMPPMPFGQHGMPPPPNMPNMNFSPFPPGPNGPPPPPMPPQGFPPPFPFHEGMMPFGAGPDGLRSPQHQHLGGPPGMFTGR
ncbi:hypothetical protein AA313_de0202210 [Arthrobotrys entomopaga]|nr:hypothetical protein AA313_de0202210 [Arthrobotrys entomopaga]